MIGRHWKLGLALAVITVFAVFAVSAQLQPRRDGKGKKRLQSAAFDRGPGLNLQAALGLELGRERVRFSGCGGP